MKRWKLTCRRGLADYGPFRVREDTLVSPRTGEAGTYQVLEVPDWANVIALVDDGRAIMVRQYRFGSESFTLEIPGGVLEPGESALEGIVRELREETGYVAEEVVELGFVQPNPAIQNNRCTTFLATGCRKIASQNLDPGEDITVELHALDELYAMVRRGELTHSLVVAALGMHALSQHP